MSTQLSQNSQRSPRPLRRLAPYVGATFVLTLTSAAAAQISIEASQSFATGAQPSGSAVGDFTSDGLPDIATTIDGPDRIQILVGDGAGLFVAGPVVALGANAGAGDVIAFDLDNDGDLDLAACLKNQATVRVFRNLGGGAFESIGSFVTGGESVGPDAADFNNDGFIDLVVANRDDDSVTVLSNSLGTSFTSITFATGPDPRGATFADLDSDNDLDVVATAHDDRTVRLFRNDGGTFTPMLTLNLSPTVRPEGIDAGDLNGDGLADIAVAASGNGASFASVFLRNGSGFTGPTNAPTSGVDASSIVITDLECDGDRDIAVVNQSSNNVSLLGNAGNGTFGAPILVAVGASPDAIGAGDIDGDGDIDLAVPNSDANTMSVIRMGCGTGGGGGTPVCGNGICEPNEIANCIDCQGPGGDGNPGPVGTFAFTSALLLTGPQPDGVAALDIDGDADLDLAVVVEAPDRVQLFMNAGDATFTPGAVVFLPASSSPGAIVAADFDGDDATDLAVALKDNNAIHFLRNVAGQFTAIGSVATGTEPRALCVGDADGDGKLDLATANRVSNDATFARNLGGFSFSTQTLATGTDPRGATFAKGAGPTQLLAVTGHDSRNVSLFAWNRTAYVPSGSLSTGGFVRPEGIAAADLNADGFDDLVAATNAAAANLESITVWLASATGFGAPTFYVTGGINTSFVALADLDCDGDIDAMTSNKDSSNISTLANSGTGIFGAAVLDATGATPETIVIGDFDGTGGIDVAVSNRDANALTVFVNTTCPVVIDPADLNADGAVDAGDLAILLGAWGGSGPADLNGDGTVGARDLGILLGSWS